MSLIVLLVVLIIVGIVLYQVPMDPAIRKTIMWVMIIVTVVWLLAWLGIFDFHDVSWPRG